jgi:anti-anti-sigma factor
VGLQILIRESGDFIILDLQGRSTIDGGESELLDSRLRQLLANSVRKLLLNLVNLTQVDSSGVGVIVAAYVYLKRQGGDLKFTMPMRTGAGGADCVSPARHYPKF